MKTQQLRHAFAPVRIVPASVVICLVAAACAAQAPQAAVRQVPLTLDGCASIAPGDLLDLDWNPAFDPSAAVAGVENFTLEFAGPADVLPEHSGRPSLVLETQSHMRSAGLTQSSASAGPNGFYHLQFEAILPLLQSGTYFLTGSHAVAATVPGYAGLAPQMTNSPARFRYCIQVERSTRSGRREASSR